MSDIDQPHGIMRRLTTGEYRKRLGEATREFLEGTRQGQLKGQRDVTSESETEALLKALEDVSEGRTFGSSVLRDLIYEAWLDFAVGSEAPERFGSESQYGTEVDEEAQYDIEKLEELYYSLDEESQQISCDVASDFEQLRSDDKRAAEVVALVRSWLEKDQCGKVLRVLRENRGTMSGEDYFYFCEVAWSRISRLDERFRPIWQQYAALAGSTMIAFPADRPSLVGGRDGRDTDIEQKDFVATTSEALKRRQEGKLDLLSEEESSRLLSALDSVQGFKHFDNLEFRDYLLLAWQDLSGIPSVDSSRSAEIWSKLNESQQRVANDFLEDFEVLFFHAELPQQVEDLIDVEDYVGALEAVRDYSCDGMNSSKLRAKIWNVISRANGDERLQRIADSFEGYGREFVTSRR